MILKKENRLMKRNILLSYINSGLMWGRFFIPVLALFYIASQVTLAQFSIIMSVFALSTFLLEIPTGVLADIIGKRKTLILSRAMYVLEVVMIAFFNGFWVFLIAKFISGIGVSLSSGTTSAMLFDSLKKMKKEKDYKKVQGTSAFIGYISMAIVFVIGGYLFTLSPKLPAKLSLIPLVIGFILTFFYTEPYKNSKKLTLKNSYEQLKKGLILFASNSYLKYLGMLTFLVGSSLIMMMNISSAYFKEILIPVSFIGAISFIASMISAFFSKRTHAIEARLGEEKCLFLSQVLVVIAVILMSFMVPYFGVLFYLLIPVVNGFFNVLISDYANRNIDSSHRATMLSINNMFEDLGVTLIFPILGWGIKNYSMNSSLLIFGVFMILYFSLVWIYKKSKKL